MLSVYSPSRRRRRPLLQLSPTNDRCCYAFPAGQRGALLALLRRRGIKPSAHQRRGGGLDMAGPSQVETLVSVGQDRLWVFSTAPERSTLWHLLADLVEVPSQAR